MISRSVVGICSVGLLSLSAGIVLGQDYPNKPIRLVCNAAGGSGDITESQRIWRLERVVSQMGSGVIHDGHFFTVSQEGVAVCMELQSGKTVWEKRLRGAGSRGGSWSSMLLADGKIYIPNQSGDVFVFAASPNYELLATNSVDESTNASPAASNGELLLRTDDSLWCIANDQ